MTASFDFVPYIVGYKMGCIIPNIRSGQQTNLLIKVYFVALLKGRLSDGC